MVIVPVGAAAAMRALGNDSLIAYIEQLVLAYDPGPPFAGIDWSQVDRDMLDPVVDQWINEGLADRPDLCAKLCAQSVGA